VYSELNAYGFGLCEYRSTRIAFFLGAVEIAEIAFGSKIRLIWLHFSFLYTEYIGICLSEKVAESLC
jgi:hypothetical protein